MCFVCGTNCNLKLGLLLLQALDEHLSLVLDCEHAHHLCTVAQADLVHHRLLLPAPPRVTLVQWAAA